MKKNTNRKIYLFSLFIETNLLDLRLCNVFIKNEHKTLNTLSWERNLNIDIFNRRLLCSVKVKKNELFYELTKSPLFLDIQRDYAASLEYRALKKYEISRSIVRLISKFSYSFIKEAWGQAIERDGDSIVLFALSKKVAIINIEDSEDRHFIKIMNANGRAVYYCSLSNVKYRLIEIYEEFKKRMINKLDTH